MIAHIAIAALVVMLAGCPLVTTSNATPGGPAHARAGALPTVAGNGSLTVSNLIGETHQEAITLVHAAGKVVAPSPINVTRSVRHRRHSLVVVAGEDPPTD